MSKTNSVSENKSLGFQSVLNLESEGLTSLMVGNSMVTQFLTQMFPFSKKSSDGLTITYGMEIIDVRNEDGRSTVLLQSTAKDIIDALSLSLITTRGLGLVEGLNFLTPSNAGYLTILLAMYTHRVTGIDAFERVISVYPCEYDIKSRSTSSFVTFLGGFKRGINTCNSSQLTEFASLLYKDLSRTNKDGSRVYDIVIVSPVPVAE